MRVTVEVAAGPSAGLKMTLQTGQVGLVGRATWAQISAPGDMSLAGRHFEINVGPRGCVLHALNNQYPVFLNGKKVRQEELQPGDEIVAGDNTFRVHVEVEAGEAPPPPRPEPTVAVRRSPAPPPPVVPRPKSDPALTVLRKRAEARPPTLLDVLRDAQPLYALLDAAREPRVLTLLAEYGEEHQCLYEGPAAEELAEVAPYLVALPAKSKLLEVLARDGWGQSWGCFLQSKVSLRELRKHLRRFLTVEANGDRVLFRYYDPRVLRVFLPVCNAAETAQFFGPVDAFLVEGREPEIVVKYTATQKGIKEDLTLLMKV